MKQRGIFLRAEETDAVVLSNVTEYKLKSDKNGKFYCGFPKNSLDKISERLKKEEISFRVVWPKKDESEYPEEMYEAENSRYNEFNSLEGKKIWKHGEKGTETISTDIPEYEFLKWICETSEHPGVNCKIDITEHDTALKFRRLKEWIDSRFLESRSGSRKNQEMQL